MPVFVSHTTIDCRDAYNLSEWRREILACRMDPDGPNESGHEECAIHDPESGHTMLFIEVPDIDLTAKRIHFDVRPRERSQDQ